MRSPLRPCLAGHPGQASSQAEASLVGGAMRRTRAPAAVKHLSERQEKTTKGLVIYWPKSELPESSLVTF